MPIDRREFVQGLAASCGLLPLGSLWANGGSLPSPRLVVVMLRGAVDGLSVVVPHAEPEYYRVRGTIAIARPGTENGVLDLDGRFGLHPACAPLLPWWQRKQLAFIHAAGSPNASRSHFDAQDYLDTAVPGDKRVSDGWLNRLLVPMARHDGAQALSVGPTLPRVCRGDEPITAALLGGGLTVIDKTEVRAAFDQLYGQSAALGAQYQRARAARDRLLADLSSASVSSGSSEAATADAGAGDAQGFALEAGRLGLLMQRNPALRLGCLQVGGWDTHVQQGGANGALARRLALLASGLAALANGLGEVFKDTVVVVMSEFGRTVAQNGNEGTDHGHGNVIWLLGGRIGGGRIHGQWPGLEPAALYERRDLAVTTDYRSVLRAIAERHLKLDDQALSSVFPKAPATDVRLSTLFA